MTTFPRPAPLFEWIGTDPDDNVQNGRLFSYDVPMFVSLLAEQGWRLLKVFRVDNGTDVGGIGQDGGWWANGPALNRGTR
jgi:hypothetical protein